MRRWQITGLTAALLATIIVAEWLVLGFNEDFVRALVRVTARVSVVLFVLAFSAASLRALFPSGTTLWVAQNRRYIGVSFALSHFVHLGTLFALAAYFPHPFVDDLNAISLVGGGLAYVFIAAMTVTSFAPPRRLIGERAWHLLHTTGSYYIWLIFVNSYVSRAVQDLAYLPFAVLLVGALGLRIAFAIMRAKARKAEPAPGAVATETPST